MKVGSDAKFDYYYLVFSNAGVDRNWKLNLYNPFTALKNCDRNDKRSLIRNL